MPTLKPCPFCGGTVIQRNHIVDSGGDAYRSFVIECASTNNCYVHPWIAIAGPWGYRHPADLLDNQTAYELAQERWNKRTDGFEEQCLKADPCPDCGPGFRILDEDRKQLYCGKCKGVLLTKKTD